MCVRNHQLSDVLHSKHQHISGICMLMLRSPQRWMLWGCVVHVAGARPSPFMRSVISRARAECNCVWANSAIIKRGRRLGLNIT